MNYIHMPPPTPLLLYTKVNIQICIIVTVMHQTAHPFLRIVVWSSHSYYNLVVLMYMMIEENTREKCNEIDHSQTLCILCILLHIVYRFYCKWIDHMSFILFYCCVIIQSSNPFWAINLNTSFMFTAIDCGIVPVLAPMQDKWSLILNPKTLLKLRTDFLSMAMEQQTCCKIPVV